MQQAGMEATGEAAPRGSLLGFTTIGLRPNQLLNRRDAIDPRKDRVRGYKRQYALPLVRYRSEDGSGGRCRANGKSKFLF